MAKNTNTTRHFVRLIVILIGIILFALLIFALKPVQRTEAYTQIKDSALVLLTREPNESWLNLVQTLAQNYDVYVIIDNNDSDLSTYKSNYADIRFLQIDDAECANAGYKNSSTVLIKKTPIAWDKALYYFCSSSNNYSKVWFVEDDVYIPSKTAITEIDAKYPDTDLICNKSNYNDTGTLEGWMWWKEADKYFALPWSGGLQCICRMSAPLLRRIDEFVKAKQSLVFIEVLFPTLAQQNGLTIANPPEFANVDCCEKWDFDKIDPAKICHPVKQTKDQDRIRQKL